MHRIIFFLSYEPPLVPFTKKTGSWVSERIGIVVCCVKDVFQQNDESDIARSDAGHLAVLSWFRFVKLWP